MLRTPILIAASLLLGGLALAQEAPPDSNASTSTAAQQQHAQEQESHSADYTARHSTSGDNDNN